MTFAPPKRHFWRTALGVVLTPFVFVIGAAVVCGVLCGFAVAGAFATACDVAGVMIGDPVEREG